MSVHKLDHRFFEEMQAEHKELGALLRAVQAQLESDDRTKRDTAELVARLADLCGAHFNHEEQGGYMREAVTAAPWLADRVRSLLEEHETLLEAIESLRILVQSGIESAAWWKRVENDFHKFAAHLREHEANENLMVQQAFCDDLGQGE
jgi:hemerythrin